VQSREFSTCCLDKSQHSVPYNIISMQFWFSRLGGPRHPRLHESRSYTRTQFSARLNSRLATSTQQCNVPPVRKKILQYLTSETHFSLPPLLVLIPVHSLSNRGPMRIHADFLRLSAKSNLVKWAHTMSNKTCEHVETESKIKNARTPQYWWFQAPNERFSFHLAYWRCWRQLKSCKICIYRTISMKKWYTG
jgi:hypothetical protein